MYLNDDWKWMIRSCVSNAAKQPDAFGNVIAMICSGTSHMAHVLDICMIYMHNTIITKTCIYFQERFIFIITIFIQILVILIIVL